MKTVTEHVVLKENCKKRTSLYFNMEEMRKKKQYQAPGCPFCIENLKESDIVLTDGVSFLRKNKMPIVQGADMYVLVESLIHDQHIEDMDTAGARGVLSFAFESMEWARQAHIGKEVILLKNRGTFAGGSQPHPHLQVVALPDFDVSLVDFKADRILCVNEKFQIGLQTEMLTDLYQLVLTVPTAERTSQEAVHALQILLRWVISRHGNYNLAHRQEGGMDVFKIIPRWVGAVYGFGYGHYWKYDESELELIQKDICQLMDGELHTKRP